MISVRKPVVGILLTGRKRAKSPNVRLESMRRVFF